MLYSKSYGPERIRGFYVSIAIVSFPCINENTFHM